MSMIGTFDGFTSARLGIYAAQQGLRVTGNNVANINTAGYTRQRVDQSSFKVGNNDVYRSRYDNHIGSGALVTGINQIRDPYLDIRYRTISTDTYHNDTWLSGLQDIAAILDEVGKGENNGDGMLYAQLQDLAEKLRAYSADPNSDNETLVRTSAAALTSLFHSAANGLDRIFEDTIEDFNKNITKVNEILTNIRDLNKSIRTAEIHGDTALEMRDERNRQIDELSKYLDIRVEYSFEDIGGGIQVEKLTIRLDNANPDLNVRTDSSVLVDGLYATQLSVPDKRPAINTRDDDYLQGYRYLRAITEDEAKELGYDPADLATWKDDDGNEFYLIGTNDPNVRGVVTEENTNYTIQLGKLLDAYNRVMQSSETTWTEVSGGQDIYYKFACIVNGSGLSTADGKNQFTIGTKTFTVVDTVTDENTQISFADTQNAERFAAFVAKQLKDDPRYSGYEVTSAGTRILFKALNPNDPTKPSLVAQPENNGLISTGEMTELAPDIEYLPPADMSDKGKVVTDEYGNTVTTDYTQLNGRWYRLEVATEYSHETYLDDNDLRGILQAQRELLTEEGEFSSDYDLLIDENATIKRGIPYYIKSLDLLAQKFAEAFNELNTGYKIDQNGNYLDENNKVIEIAGQPVNRDGFTQEQIAALKDPTSEYYDLDYLDEDGEPDLNKWLEKNLDFMEGCGPLFSNRGDGDYTDGINAHNIEISYSWSHGGVHLIPKYEVLFADDENPDGMDHSTQNTNADHMVALLSKSLTYDPRDLNGSDATGPRLFTGSFNDMFSNMMAVEANDERITKVQLTNDATRLDELDYSREGVSGVDLNDEAMNMMQFQKAMNAAMRVMTAIDEVLDRLINNTGIAGR